MKKRYKILIEYQGESEPKCNNPLWELTEEAYSTDEAVREAYKAQAESFNYKILKVKKFEN